MKLFLSGKSSKCASVSSPVPAAEPEPTAVHKYVSACVFGYS